MAIDFTNGVGNLFNRLGRIFNGMTSQNSFAGTTIVGINTRLQAQYTTADNLIPTLSGSVVAAQGSVGTFQSALQTIAANTLVTTVQNDAPQPAASMAYAMPQLITEMVAAGAKVQKCVVGASSVASTNNTGTGALIISTTDANGFTLENLMAEVFNVTCTADAQPGNGTTAGQESFVAAGTPTQPRLAYTWPGGSGGNTSLSVQSADIANQPANVLTNSNFETWTTTNTLSSWTTVVGTYGGTVVQTTGSYTGSYALCIKGNGSELTMLSQNLRTASVPGIITPQTKYVLAFRSKVSAVPAAGILRVALKNTTSGTIYGSVSATLSGETSAYALHSTTFNMPLLLPTTLVAVIELTTALTNTDNVIIDELVIGQMTQHRNGPFFSLLRGNVNFIRGDLFAVTTTNDGAGLFQQWFNRAFNMDQNGWLLPSTDAGNTTIPNSYVTG